MAHKAGSKEKPKAASFTVDDALKTMETAVSGAGH